MSPCNAVLVLLINFTVSMFVIPEASKRVMQYLARVSGKGQEVDTIKEQLLQSNPVLEGT